MPQQHGFSLYILFVFTHVPSSTINFFISKFISSDFSLGTDPQGTAISNFSSSNLPFNFLCKFYHDKPFIITITRNQRGQKLIEIRSLRIDITMFFNCKSESMFFHKIDYIKSRYIVTKSDTINTNYFYH